MRRAEGISPPRSGIRCKTLTIRAPISSLGGLTPSARHSVPAWDLSRHAIAAGGRAFESRQGEDVVEQGLRVLRAGVIFHGLGTQQFFAADVAGIEPALNRGRDLGGGAGGVLQV